MRQKSFLIKGLFTPANVQEATIRGWNEQLGWGFTEQDFDVLHPTPNWPSGPLQALVLTPFLETEELTRNALLDVAECNSGITVAASYRENRDRRLVRTLHGIEHHRGLRWAKVDFGANRGFSALELRSATSSPHAEVLAAAAHFPEWIRRMNGTEVPYVIIPGYEYNYSYCPAISSSYRMGRTLGYVGLNYWDEEHTVAQIIGRAFRDNKYVRDHYNPYSKATRTRTECNTLIARIITNEIVKIIEEQPEFEVSIASALGELKRRTNDVSTTDIDMVLRSPEFSKRLVIVNRPNGHCLQLR